MFSKVLSRHPFIDPFLKKPIFLRTARGSWRIFSVTEYCPSTLTIQLQRNVVRWVGSIRMPKTGMGWNWSAFFLLGYTKSKTPLITPVIWTHADTQLDTLNTSCEPNIPIISHWRDSVQSRAFEEVLRCFSRKNILASIHASSSRPVESAFQVEFYRAFTSLVGHGAGLSSEWSYSSDGRIDFLVHDSGWGIEILRDGDRLRNHCNRFRLSGQYGDWIRRGVLKDWVIIDCRHTWPKKMVLPPNTLRSPIPFNAALTLHT